jgi:hypothetical protein
MGADRVRMGRGGSIRLPRLKISINHTSIDRICEFPFGQPSLDPIAIPSVCPPQFLDRPKNPLPDPLPIHVAILQQRVESPAASSSASSPSSLMSRTISIEFLNCRIIVVDP